MEVRGKGEAKHVVEGEKSVSAGIIREGGECIKRGREFEILAYKF